MTKGNTVQVAMVALVLVAGSAHAAITWEWEDRATDPDLPGYKAVILNVASDADPITSVVVDVTTAMNQLHPFGQTVTLFTTNNGLFAFDPATDGLVDQDSQILFHEDDDTLLVATKEESDTRLFSAFTGTAGSLSFMAAPLFRVVVPEQTELVPLENVKACVVSGGEMFCIPEPTTMSLLALGGLAALIRRRK